MKDRNQLLNEAVRKVSELLVNEPQAMTLVLKKEGGRSFYAWAEDSIKAKKVRKEAREILKGLWQGGDYNFDEIATKLRVQPLDVQAILDDQFRNKHNIR